MFGIARYGQNFIVEWVRFALNNVWFCTKYEVRVYNREKYFKNIDTWMKRRVIKNNVINSPKNQQTSSRRKSTVIKIQFSMMKIPII